MTDAEATVKFAIRMAITNTCHKTGLRAGPVSEELINEVYREITDKSVRWALKEVSK